MTLRHRLLFVYLIVVLLSIATVGVAVFELSRTQQIYGPLLTWSDIVLDSQRLKGAFPPEDPQSEDNEFVTRLAAITRRINDVKDYLDVGYIRDLHLLRVNQAYAQWRKETQPEARTQQAQSVNEAIESFASVTEPVLEDLKLAAKEQETRKWALLTIISGLIALDVVILARFLRRWLLHPMEQLNRQVEALAQDRTPSEPLLTSPLEMARLAAALDKARQSLQVYRQQLIDNERLTTIGQFAAQLAHNLRNPLASIRAAAQVTTRHERENAYVRERMDEVIASVDRLNQWIGGLMEIARREHTQTRNADVVPLLHRIGEALKPELTAKEIKLSVDAPADGLICAHDPATLEQALVAMVVNAIEASPLGQSIVLRAERLSGKKMNSLESDRGGSGIASSQPPLPDGRGSVQACCRISVNDQGPGLPAENPERIFEFSYSTKQHGMGLGLALARLALERQGGEAHAYNSREGGAVVYVDLPVIDEMR